MLGGATYAATQDWDAGVNSNWNTTAANWSGTVWTNNNDAVFGATGIGTVTIASGGVSSNSLTFNNPGYTISGGTLELTGAADITANADAVITSTIAGSKGLTKDGAGTLILGGTNTYAGATTINSGTLQAGAATSAFGVNSAVTLANAAGATLDLNSLSNTIGSLSGGGMAGGALTLGNAILTVGGDNSLTTYSGSISDNNYGAVSISKVGTGKLTLTGTCNMHGQLTISGGVLELAYGSSLYPTGWGGAVINAGGTLLLHDWGYGSQDGFGWLNGPGNPITIDGGTIEQAGGGVRWLWGLVLGQRWFAIGPGGATLQSDAGVNWEIGNGWGFVLTNNSSLTLTGEGTGQLDAPVTGTGTLTMNGSGTWTLAGANNYTGTTAVNSGTLCLTSGSHGAATVASGATLSVTGPVAMAQVPGVATGGILNFGLGGVGASGAIQITGTYAAPSSPIAITVSNMNCGLGGGTYNLITGAAGISADSFVLNSVPSGYTCALSVSNGTLALAVVASPTSPTAALGASGTAGSEFSYQIALVSNPTGYGATGLPPGLSLNPSTGLISGTPTDAGTYFATISSTGAAGTASSQLIIVVPEPVGTPALSTAVPRGYFTNVPESAGYTLVCSLDIPSTCNFNAAAPAYSVDTRATVGTFTRVAYYMELQESNGTIRYVWASMNPFTADAGQIGVPTAASGANFNQAVTGLNVVSNVSGVTTGTGLSGSVDFSPQGTGMMSVSNADGTLFGFGNWNGGSGYANVGIGSGNLAPANGYRVKSLQVLVLNSGTTMTVQPAPDTSLLINPGKGFVEYWGPSAHTDKWIGVGYSRTNWSTFEPAEGVCDWSWSDTLIANYAAHGLPFGFGVINTDENTLYETPAWVFAPGSNPATGSVYPQGADPLTVICPNGVQTVIPSRWEDPVYLLRMKEFIAAFGAKYNGNPNIAFIQMLNYGLWGEGNGCFSPGLTQVSPSTLLNDYCMPFVQAFPNTQLMEDVIYPSVASSLIASGCGDFTCGIMSGVTTGAPMLIAYPNHPTQMEYYGMDPSVYRGGAENELLLWVTSGRPTYMVFIPDTADSDPNFYQMVGNLIGYHFTLEQATIPKSITANVAFPLSFTWYNDGVAPLTLPGTSPCNVAVALLDADNNLVQKQWLPTSNPKGWMPGVPVTENFSNVSFSSVPTGYKLAVGLFLNQSDANPTFKLANQGRTNNGWYIISGSSPNPAPAQWTNASGGSWQTGGNWVSNSSRNGPDAAVDFSTLNLANDATVTLDGSVSVGTLVFGDTTPGNNWILNTGTAGALTMRTTTGEPCITVNNQTATINAQFNSSTGFVKNGSGTLVLGNVNDSVFGNITVNGGVLDVSAVQLYPFNAGNQANASTWLLTVNSGATLRVNNLYQNLRLLSTSASSMVINGGTIDLSATSGWFNDTRNFTIGALGATLSVSQPGAWWVITTGDGPFTNNTKLSLDGSGNGGLNSPIVGTGTLTKNGSGTWHLQGTNSYTGATAINSGTLYLLGSTAALGSSSAVTLANVAGATLQTGWWDYATNSSMGTDFSIGSLSGGGTLGGNVSLCQISTMTVGTDNTSTTYAGCISDQFGPANVTKTGTATWTLTGANTYVGTTTISGGSLQLGDGMSDHDGSLASPAIVNDANLVYNLSGASTYVGNISGTGSLVKSGGGTLTLTGSNTYSGETTVNAGTLGMSQSNSTSSLAVAAGATLALGGANGSPGPLVLSGTLALAGGSNLDIVLGSSASDSIQVTGTYVAPVGTVSINLSSNQGGLSAGIYNLITGATGISAANFALGTAPTGYGYALSASNGTLSLTVTPPASQPTGLTATGGNASVALGWTASSGAVSYNVKRSSTSGGGYVTIASGVTGTTYTDNSVSNGKTYYYVVSAVNAAGESPNSTQASAMPVNQVALSSPWAKTDVGTATGGSSVYDGGSTFTVTGAGRGLRTSADACQLAYVKTTSTNFSVTARVTTAPTGTAQVGVMIRSGTTSSTTPGATMVAVMLDLNSGSYRARLGYRTTANNNMAWASAVKTGLAVPQWLRLTRAGNLYTGEISNDGQTWTPVSTPISVIIDSGAPAYCGIAVSSGSASSLLTETFDNVSVPGWTAPPVAPDGLSASAASQTQINLGWTAVSGATGYQVWRSNSWGGSYSQIGTPAGTTYQDNGLSAGTTYYYMVRATSGSGTSGNSTVATATTPPNPPAITSGLSATGTPGTAFIYQIYGSNIPTGFSATNLPPGLVVNTGTGVISGTPTATGTTNVTIGATNAGGTGSATLVITVLPPPPAAPAGFTAIAGNGQVALAWSATPGATGYNLKRSLASGGNYVTILSNTAATSYNDTGLTNWTACYYVVSALNAGGEGANSSEVSAQPQSPPISAEETGASSSIRITGGTGTVVFKASVAGHFYQLQYSDSLAGGQWIDYGTPQFGTGGDLIFVAPYDNTLPRRFYRLKIRQ
jgi:autotransporter-associated beta strand protein